MISEQMTGKFPFRSVLPHIRIPRNRLTRTVAALLALAIIGGLGFLIDRQTGNPISLRLAQHAVVQHFETHHEGEGYVVGPMRFLGWTVEGHSARYYCKVYKLSLIHILDRRKTEFTFHSSPSSSLECVTRLYSEIISVVSSMSTTASAAANG